MGNFFGSAHVRSTDQGRVESAVATVVAKRRSKAFVARSDSGWISVYFRESDDHRPVEALAQILNDCELLQLIVHDDDVFMYNFYEAGAEADCYTSSPGFFAQSRLDYEVQCSGRLWVFEALLGAQKTHRLGKLLNRNNEFLIESERMKKVADLFGIRRAATSYEILAAKHKGMDKSLEYVHFPKPKPKARKKGL